MQPIAVNSSLWDSQADAYAGDFLPAAGFNTNANAAAILAPAGVVTGNGSIAIVDPKENNSFRFLNNALAQNGSVGFSDGKYTVAGISRSTISRWVEELSLTVQMVSDIESTSVKPRVALYRPFTASMDEGWTRWLFERFGFEFTNIGNADFQLGGLNKRFDVILLASERPATFTDGLVEGSVPPQYAGGMEDSGIRGLNDFVTAGGTLVTLNQSSSFAIDALHLPVKDVTAELDRKDYFAGSSILAVETDNSHPVMAGMPHQANIFVSRSPVFSVLEGFEGQALAKYQVTGSPLRSGYLLGEKHIQGYAASLDVKHGDGHVILLGFAPQWRGQTMGTYRVLFNSVYYGSELARTRSMNTRFWSAPGTRSLITPDTATPQPH
jgi:hypothetical protein